MNLKRFFCIGGYLRAKCFIIGYWTLLAAIIDLISYIWVSALISGGFQCDASPENLNQIDWKRLVPLLMFLNFGTHGFYSYPLIVNISVLNTTPRNTYTEPRKCYPGMLHMYHIDFSVICTNIFWLHVVISYVKALHKKDPQAMRWFVRLSMLKLLSLIVIAIAQPEELFLSMKIVDICLTLLYLLTVKLYMLQLQLTTEEKPLTVDKPPPYECSMDAVKIAPSKQELEGQIAIAVAESDKDKSEKSQV